ncbi:MAG: 6-phosphogluconolactonase [Planctomycetes bacterium]|nr:6-phosphogluconolactonase [Planctomycetota bacterium]
MGNAGPKLPRDVRVHVNVDEQCAAAARFVVGELASALARAPRASFALAGGSTPKRLFERLVKEHARALDWSRVHCFFGDERCVPFDSPDSNFRAANESLFEPLAIPRASIHPMPAEALDHDAAAREHERELRAFFGASEMFDVAMLGMGEDGHVASLFPGEPALAERERWVVHVETRAKPPPHRLTLTLPAFARSRTVFFLLGGESKRDALHRVLEPRDDADRALPAARVTARERIVWFVDRAAHP